MKHTFIRNAISLAVLTAAFSPFQVVADDVEQVMVIGQRPASIAQLEVDSLDSLAPDMRDSLLRLPGMNANGNGPLTSIAQYRGLFGDRLRVNLDGAPVMGAGPNAMDPPLSNVFATPGTQITLYRGVAPVTVGAETLGGAISVQRDHSTLFNGEGQWRGNLNIQAQDQGSVEHYLGSLGYHSNNVFGQAFATHQQRDNIDDGNGKVVPNSFYERRAMGFQGGIRAGNHQLTGSYQRIDTDDTGTAALAMDIIYIDSSAWRLHYQWQDTDVGTLSLRAFGNSNQHGMNNTAYRGMTMPPMARLNTVDSLSRGYELQWLQNLGAGELTTGADWQSTSYNSVITNPVANNLTINNFNDVERSVSSVFGQWRQQMDSTDVTVGARYTQVDTNAGDVASSMAMMNPNIATLVNNFNEANRDLEFDFLDVTLHLNGELNSNWMWHLAAGQKGRAPSYQELFVWLPLGISAGLADGRNYLGNLNLDSEKSRQLDLGVTYQATNYSLSPRIFYQDISDFIVGNPSTSMPANMISNMMTGRPPLQWGNADATLYGFDVLLTAKFNQYWHLEVNAQLVRGDRDDLNEPLYRIAPASLLTRLVWQESNWRTELEWQLVAEQSDVSIIQDELQSAGYGIVNGLFSYQVTDNLEVSIQGINLLDKAYQPHLTGINRIAGIEQPQGQRLFAPGRTLAATVNLRF